MEAQVDTLQLLVGGQILLSNIETGSTELFLMETKYKNN
jgi:hypothetical protein